MSQSTWLIVLAVFLVSLAVPAVLRPLLDKLGVVDVPNDRSSHVQPAVRGVGIAPLTALASGGLLILVLLGSGEPWATLLACLGVATGAACVGLYEDLRGIQTPIRFGLQIAVGSVGAFAIVNAIGVAMALIPLGALTIAAYINAANFMDGIDGISGLHGVVVGSIYATIGAIVGATWLVLGGMMLAVAFLGFLPWNVWHGRMFLGDVGSYLLGGLVAALAFAAFVDGVSAVALIAPVLLYLVDTGTTLVRRMRRGERWFEAHRTHIYQQLTDRGFSHLQVASIVAGGSLLAGMVGLLALDGSVPMTAISVTLMGLIAAWYVRSARTPTTATP